MASIVFFRAANVGGHQVFQPGALARELAHLGVVNLGAAGTFVVLEEVTAPKLRDEILGRLPFKPELIICSAREVLTLLGGGFFHGKPAGGDIGRFVTVLDKVPTKIPALPMEQPPGKKWEVTLVAASGRFVLSVRRLGKTYPNALVEKQFKVRATTRSWHTFLAIGEILEK